MLIEKPRFPIKDILLFGFLPGFFKKLIYRLKGYRIGKNVSIGFGSVICGDEVLIGNFTTIGFLTIIRGKKISIGDYVNIGSVSFLDTPYIEIGDGSRINEQVFVGGLQFPDSKFIMGRNCQVMQMSFLNPTRSIIIGDDSGIGGNCMLFGHNSWLSRFEGYPVDFEPIEIGKSVSVSWGAFLLPGTKIGDGAVIGAQSVVNRSVPEKCLAIGFPARIVSKFPDFPREVTWEEKVEMIRNIVSEMLEFFRDSGLPCNSKGNIYEVTKAEKKLLMNIRRTMRFSLSCETPPDDTWNSSQEDIDVFLSLWAIPVNLRKELIVRQVMWIDVENKEQSFLDNDLGNEIILYLRRYGVRFIRVNL
ncbi:MAG: hypothetical protein C4518_06945 [Desulfobacteraceae bacterium]|nr:MAG: hypothetical protein C4518_06945 [Desulfobacteraceae bacterium]